MILASFIFAFLIRAISGIQNALGYSGSRYLVPTTLALLAIVMFAGLFSPIEQYNPLWLIRVISAVLVTSVAVYCAISITSAFTQLNYHHIHLYETILMAASLVSIGLVDYDLIAIVASTYPALIVHQVVINLATNQKWNSNATDVYHGKWYTINIGKRSFKIPRMTFSIRLVIAIISCVLFIVYVDRRLSLTLSDILNWIL